MASKLRNYLNQNSTIVTVAAAVALLLSLVYILSFLVGGTVNVNPIPVYFYDLNTGQLYSAMSTEIPPIEAPSGKQPSGAPAGVKAYVFSCGDCSNEKERFIGWLEMYTPKARAMLLNPQSMSQMGPGGGPPAPGGGGMPPDMSMMMELETGHLLARFVSPEQREAKKKAAAMAAEIAESAVREAPAAEVAAADTAEAATTEPAEAEEEEEVEAADTGSDATAQAPAMPSTKGIKDPTGLEWVSAQSPGGFEVMQVLQEHCPNGAMPRPCIPGK